MLLEVLRGVQAVRGPGWSCEILLRRGGVLSEEFASFGPVHQLSQPWADGLAFRAKVLRALIDRPWMQPRRLAGWVSQWQREGFDLVYNNTGTNGFVVPALRRLGCPILTHVHELGYSLRRFNTAISLRQTLDNTDHFLAVSSPVAQDLGECGVPDERITVASNFLSAMPPETDSRVRAVLRAKLGIAPEALVVTGCGHIDWLKGTDLFVETAARLSGMTAKNILYNWIGGETDAYFAWKVRRLVRRRGLEDKVCFIGPVRNPGAWFAASDVVAVTSRVESFSLVALEAAAAGRPVVGFSGARGLVSLLGDESSMLVPDYNPAALASVVHELLRDSARAQALGQRLRGKVATEFLAGPRIAALLSVVDKIQRNRTI